MEKDSKMLSLCVNPSCKLLILKGIGESGIRTQPFILTVDSKGFSYKLNKIKDIEQLIIRFFRYRGYSKEVKKRAKCIPFCNPPPSGYA